MACSLRPDQTFACDFLGTVGQVVNIKVQGTVPVTIVQAHFNGAPDTVSAGQTGASFTIPAGGGALLLGMIIAPGDTAQVLEDCGGGQTQLLRQTTAINPVVRITICA